MASLYDLAMQYLNQSLPKTFKYDRTNQPGTNPPPITIPPQDPNAPVKRILPVQGGGGDGFSVYNSDPNRTRTEDNYSPYSYRQAAERNLIGTPGGSLTGTNIPNTSTEVAKLMDMYPDYYEGKQLTGIPGAAANYLKNSFIGKGLEYLGDKMPVNQRAILENELLGQGFQLNDIGQIVSDGGDYDTAANVMSGYNANQITRQTFEKRRNKIKETMSKPGYKGNLQERLDALDEAEAKFFGGSAKATTVFNDKLKQKDIDDGFINDQIPTYDEEIKTSTYSEDEEDNILDDILDPMKKPTSIYTATAPTYLDNYPTTITGSGDGTGTTGSVDPAGINTIDSTVYADNNNEGSTSTSGLTYNQGGGQDGSYDFVEQNFGNPDPYSDDNFMAGDNSKASPSGNIFDGGSTYDEAGVDTGSGNDNGNNNSGGTHCCTAANERGDMTLLEVKKLRVWHRRQSKIWQRGYDVWGRVMADNLVAKYKWSSDRVRDFYNHKIYGKRTIGSTFADFCIYPMSMIIGSILTVMPPILGYQENKTWQK
jgi:hypothetical protein